VPDEGVVFGDQHIGMAIAVEIDELEVGVAQVAVEARGKRPERLPSPRRHRARTGRAWAVQHHQVGLAISGQIHELRAAAQRHIGLERDVSIGANFAFTTSLPSGNLSGSGSKVALVEPGAACSVRMPGMPSPCRSVHW
jgi:hypothetical protein